MQILAEQIRQAVADSEPIDMQGSLTTQRVMRTLGIGDRANPAREQAMAQLLQRLDDSIRSSTTRLIALHGLDGNATQTVLQRLRENFSARERVDEGRAALWSSLVGGALTGLKADLAAGGLTFGAGMLVGGVIGGLTGAGVARGFNKLAGRDRTVVRFAPAFVDGLVRSAVLRYLAVAHFGRGRGQYVEGEAPAFWQGEVERAFATHAARFQALWPRIVEQVSTPTELQNALAALVRQVLTSLYPGAFALSNGAEAPGVSSTPPP